MIKIAPSILSADFSVLRQEINKLEECGADLLHIDVMDGLFVPNITIGAPVVKALRKHTNLPFDVHLMIENPDRHIEDFVKAGSDIITVHVEATTHLHRTIQNIKSYGVKCGVALNPATSLNEIEWILSDIDMVLLMTVNPGFGGQSYIESMTKKVMQLKSMVDKNAPNVDIEVDGGISTKNIQMLGKAGANIFVSGSTIFKASDMKETISKLKNLGGG